MSTIELAQRRPGPRPRRHLLKRRGRVGGSVRSTKAGAETPATRRRAIRLVRPSCPLNEGRGRDPGDTVGFGEPFALFCHAQRRPGPRPRRHSDSGTSSALVPNAQRRPGPRPRRHNMLPSYPPGPVRRSTKAGAETPATLLIGAEHLHGRNSVPDLPTPDSDFDHLFGLCLGMDVVTDPQMSSKSATNHNFEPSGA